MKTLVTCLLFLAAPMVVLAQDDIAGRSLFENHCATCHGVDGGGAGPMAQVLMIPPTDLTQLARTNENVFPMTRVIARIDGRDPLLSHGSPMPVFGPIFDGRGETIRGSEGILIMTSQPVIDVVSYMQTLQDLS